MKKTWNNAELEELQISETAGGAYNNHKIDGPYNDKNDNWPMGEDKLSN